MLTSSKALNNLLETNLLWLPSIAAIDLSWPEKVLKGAAAIFSPRHFSLIWSTLLDSAKRNLLLVLVMFVFASGCFTLRERLWADIERRAAMVGRVQKDSRYLAIFSIVMIGIPVLCAIFASLGYYETTSELLYRLFISGWLLVGTYVAYGTTRRTVVVSKRRLALKQAVERRDKAVKARMEQKEAEDRGEETAPPPAVDYEEIDIETVSRQTEKLLNAFMVVLFAVLMWTIWSDLLPALSFFNNVEIGHYMVDIVDPETNSAMKVERAITLWNIMQALVIIGLTVMAARNLPGFLEVFALNRLGFDAGTRYAIVTILGYIIFGIGLFMSLDRLGLQWSQLKWVVTGLSVGIGLGLQKIIANFVSGLIILFERPVRLGDYVTIGEQSGNVTRIQIRATTLVDLDNREIIIPNEALISERVTNWTLSNSITRLVINVGVAYGTDTDKAALGIALLISKSAHSSNALKIACKLAMLCTLKSIKPLKKREFPYRSHSAICISSRRERR